jgi:hypothetical protein
MRGSIIVAAMAASGAASGAPMAAQAQAVPAAAAASAADPLVDPFFDALKHGQVAQALAGLTKAAPLLGKRIADAGELPKQIQAALDGYGPVLAWERIETTPLGSLLRRDTWLVQHRDYVTRWRFVYARTASGWTLTSFVFDDQVPSWFD